MPRPADVDLAELLTLAKDIAAQASAVILSMRRSAFRVSAKAAATDLVTDADHASEELIVSMLGRLRSEDAVLAEEGTDRPGLSGVRWVVDPLDGTTNFVHGLPAYAVSIGVEVAGVGAVGVVSNVESGELFSAI